VGRNREGATHYPVAPRYAFKGMMLEGLVKKHQFQCFDLGCQ